ncbi:hypothetical protein IQ07DRAFT_613824 [Pyrenochaeta sp. DS3sAY3a]|nr:hypothetical protein IQ07DRAFT_613824 [Pyrenochaeta sp. DS3sAY3a]
MSNPHSETETSASPKSSTIVIAIVVPSVMIVVFLTLVIINRRRGGVLLPRISRADDALEKEERTKMRLDELESIIKTQHFYDWLATQKEKNPGSVTTDPICAICLDDFEDDAQVRGLRCSHAFHSHCLDEWFTRYNEYCPLCHRPIIPGRRARRKARERPDPLPVILMV